MTRFLEIPKFTRNQGKLDCISVVCYKLWSLVMYNKMGSCGNASHQENLKWEAKFLSKSRGKEIELSSFCEKGVDSWEFSNTAALLICKSRAQVWPQYEFELTQLQTGKNCQDQTCGQVDYLLLGKFCYKFRHQIAPTVIENTAAFTLQ